MVAVSGVDPERLAAIVAELAEGVAPERAAVLAIRNGRRRVVLAGPPAQLARVQERCEQIEAEEAREREGKKRGGSVFAPSFDPLDTEIGFHHPALTEAVELVGSWATRCGLDADRARELAQGVLVDPVDWVEAVDGAISAGAKWILDLGPSDQLTRMTSSSLRGQGIGIIAAATPRRTPQSAHPPVQHLRSHVRGPSSRRSPLRFPVAASASRRRSRS